MGVEWFLQGLFFVAIFFTGGQESAPKCSTFLSCKTLMELMLDSLNDSLELNDRKIFNDFAPRIIKYLKENNQIHEGTINYWTKCNFLISNKIKPTMKNENRNN